MANNGNKKIIVKKDMNFFAEFTASAAKAARLLTYAVLFGIAVVGIILVFIVIGIVIGIYFKNNTWTKLQRWAIMGIVGGGLGNLVDRFFRAEGVVDFIDIKFYGLFGLERWPTFNVADSAVVVCGLLLIISFIITFVQESKEAKSQEA